MSFVTMGPMLKRAQADSYGIAAFNMFDSNSARAVVEAAAELDALILANFDECISFVENMPNPGVFAPVIGTADGFSKGQPKIAYDLLKRITAAIPIPIALHGGTGLSQDQTINASPQAVPRSVFPQCTSISSLRASWAWGATTRSNKNRCHSLPDSLMR